MASIKRKMESIHARKFFQVPLSEKDRSQQSRYVKEQVIRDMVNLIGDTKPPFTILEPGCGWGRWTIQLLLRGFNVVAVDLSSYNLGLTKVYAKSEKVYDKLDVIRADAENIPLRKETADQVLIYGLLEHLPHPESALLEVKRCLKLNGRIVIGVSNAYSPVYLMYLFQNILLWVFKSKKPSPCWTSEPGHPFYRTYTLPELRRLLASIGLGYQELKPARGLGERVLPFILLDRTPMSLLEVFCRIEDLFPIVSKSIFILCKKS